MDKEAQKKIEEIQTILERHCHRDFYVTSFNPYPAAKELYELGYRKIEGEPPLLTDSEVEQEWAIHLRRPGIVQEDVPGWFQRRMQHISDIKWYKREK